MTLHVNCPECGAGITVTVGVEFERVPTITFCTRCHISYSQDRCPKCGDPPQRASGPIIPGHGPLETKDGSHDYREGGE